MFVDKQIKINKKYLLNLDDKIQQYGKLYCVCSDPTRLKILILLKKNKELCVTDFSNILNISISAISHQLKMLENLGIITKIKMGKMVCHLLVKNSKVDLLLKNII